MKARTAIIGPAIVILCSASFWLGGFWHSRSTPTYRVDHIRVSFHTDWPVYGLPMVEFKTILAALRAGSTNTALEKAECYLDLAVYDAMRRRPLLGGWRLDELDKALRSAAQYRDQFPRPKVPHTVEANVPGLAEWSESVRSANEAREQEIDRFLKNLR